MKLVKLYIVRLTSGFNFRLFFVIIIFKVGGHMDFLKMEAFVKKTLEENNAIKPKKEAHKFRSRYEHSIRVYKWCKKLVYDLPNCNKDILYTAAIFHDVGYSCGKDSHANNSKEIFLKYAKDNNFDDNFSNEVARIISLHSNKELLNDKNSSDELIILLEADLLDEEGCMGIVWDLLAKGYNGCESYQDSLNEIWKHSAHILSQDFMVTPLAKKYWEEKKLFVREFITQFEKDLFMGE